jgi:hypothetical protein
VYTTNSNINTLYASHYHAGTDGLFDNLSLDEIGFVAHDRKNVTAAAKVRIERSEHLAHLSLYSSAPLLYHFLQAAALANQAKALSASRKPDDITVVVGCVYLKPDTPTSSPREVEKRGM